MKTSISVPPRSAVTTLAICFSAICFSAICFSAICFSAGTAHCDSADDWRKMKPIRPRAYVCARATSAVDVDGRLDEPAWRLANWTEPFVDIEGSRKPQPRFRTRAKMLWDDDYFYLCAEMEEPHVWGALTEHDSVIFHDNDFEVFIDPDGDTHEYYELEVNALNTTWDLFLPKPYKNGGKADNEWEIPGMRTAIHVDGTLNDSSDRDRGWSIEIALPWKVLGKSAHKPAPPKIGDTWRVNFSRVEWRHKLSGGRYEKIPGRREDNWVWSPQGIIDMHRPERWGYVQFAREKSAKFRPDGTDPAREALMTIYHHQKAFFQRRQRWATTLDEIGLSKNSLKKGLVAAPQMRSTEESFEADAVVEVKGARQTWSVRGDSRLRRTK